MTESVDTAADNAVDVDEARQVGVAVPPASKDEYLEASSQLQPGFVATVDATDPSVGWTSQHMNPERDMAGEGEAEVKGYREPLDNTPGQVYLPSQLPDPQAAIAAGLPPVKIPEHLITEDEDHIQGPEPVERLGLEIRDRLRRGVVKHLRHRANPDVVDHDDDVDDEVVVPTRQSPPAPPANPPAPANPPTP